MTNKNILSSKFEELSAHVTVEKGGVYTLSVARTAAGFIATATHEVDETSTSDSTNPCATFPEALEAAEMLFPSDNLYGEELYRHMAEGILTARRTSSRRVNVGTIAGITRKVLDETTLINASAADQARRKN